ncbi:hypothetical protein OU994_09420 [Pseudoduganella sp. SL102]|uniref:Oligosaccharide flippase family protein n=1 Tax=Pseudoduganella albidiflava TaxID=321983 RepID=A0A411X230_9BURK|nr:MULTISPECIES: hypothetical protein [Pseudoduganella]QBI03013.1 hypothetical protein EYF70_20840 [Pseudoduganella albidiflava]WBS04478.1 hypothetical protein OU994_09420 [Pseudoduganella sp. SL102]GGY58251.1 hypothetical protein GCM10007387_45940 [Pseudoduganella albidiflava]
MSDHPYSGANTRRNIFAFLVGKVPTAILTATILAMLARNLSATEFGRYVVCMAMLDVTLGFSTIGLDWVILRYAPVYRLHSTRARLLGLILRVALVRVFVLAAVGALIFALATFFPAAAGKLPVDLVWYFCVLMVAEGATRMLRDNALEALSLQSRLQIIMIGKSLILIATLGYMGTQGGGTAQWMLIAETAASCICLVLALAFMLTGLKSMEQPDPAWVPPTFSQMRQVALFNYSSGIVEYLFSTSFLMLVLGRFLAPATVAGAGFVVRLIEMIRNYLPGMLVFSLVRSRMIGNYVRDRNFDDLRTWARFLFKISLLTLLPVCGIAAVYGREILEVASAHRYGGYGVLFAALTFWLALRLHRLILGVVFNAADMMRLWAKASALSLLVLPPLLLIGPARLDIWFLPAVLISGEVVANVLALRIMRGTGREWETGWDWIIRSFLALGAGVAAAAFLPRQGLAWLVAGMAVLTVVYCIGALLLRVIDRTDQQLINRSSGRTLFKGV